MLKQLSKTFVLVCILFSFAFCPVVLAQNPNNTDNITGNKMELIQNDVRVNDLDIEPINVQDVKKDVIPDPHKESKKVMALFLRTMMGVAICAVILYFVLLFVKKFYNSAFIVEEDEYENLDLSTPDNKQDALRSFLDRSIK